MPYEVVDPEQRDERGTIHRTLTEAMVAARVTDEVWDLADDDNQTRTVQCWPDAEFQTADQLADRRRSREAAQHIGRADREAANLYAQHPVSSPETITALVSLAWSQGFLAGYGECAQSTMEAFDRLEGKR